MSEETKEIEKETDPTVLKVGSKTDIKVLSYAIIKCYEKHGQAKLKAVGGGAIKRAYDAIMIARAHMIKLNVELIVIPNGFMASMPDGNIIPGALMVVENR